MDISVVEELNKARKARKATVVLTDLTCHESQVLMASDIAGHRLEDDIRARLKSGKSGTVETGDGEVFIHVRVPSLRLVIIGAVHISQTLVPMAMACDYEVSVIDPRSAFATRERFGDVALYPDWPVEVLKQQPLDAHTALVALTHDPKIDDIAICEALRAGCFYAGALGSRKTHAKRLERLQEAGFSPAELERIEAPVGLDIGAATPAEIAVSVLAQIIKTQRKGVTR